LSAVEKSALKRADFLKQSSEFVTWKYSHEANAILFKGSYHHTFKNFGHCVRGLFGKCRWKK